MGWSPVTRIEQAYQVLFKLPHKQVIDHLQAILDLIPKSFRDGTDKEKTEYFARAICYEVLGRHLWEW